MDMDSCQTFLNIAYRCLHKDRNERPTMEEIIKELEITLDNQEMSQDAVDKPRYEEIIRIANQAVTPISFKSRDEFASVLSKGIVVDGGYRRISINKNGHYQEMILLEKFIPSDNSQDPLEVENFYRGSDNLLMSPNSKFRFEVSTRFLSINVTYNINLVYKYHYAYKSAHVTFKYKLHTEKEYWTSCVAQQRTDKLLSTKLYQFTSSQREHYFKFDLLGQLLPIRDRHLHKPFKPDRHVKRCMLPVIEIEFVPVEYVEDEDLEEQIKVDIETTMDLDTDWAEKISSHCVSIIEWSKNSMQLTTNKELYYLLRNGFPTNKNGDQQWFSASKNMKKRHMLPATAVLKKGSVLKSLFRSKTWIWKSLPESRFQLVVEFCEIESFTIACEIDYHFLSPETAYACYLVYKLPEKHPMVSCLVQIDDETLLNSFPDDRDDWLADKEHLVDLRTPTHIPFIGCNVHEPRVPPRARRIKAHPKLRKDGWMEIQVWDFKSTFSNKNIPMHCRVRSYDKWKFTGLLVQGIEFRPAKVSFMTHFRPLISITI